MSGLPPIVEEANRLNSEGKYNDALVLYDQVLAQNPNHPMILAAMGTIYMRDPHCSGLAISLLESALANGGNPKHSILSNLGVAYKNAGLPDAAIKCFEKSISIEENCTNLTSYGSMFVESGEADKAIKLLDKALTHDPSSHMSHWNLSLALLERGVWERAWDEYEWGMEPGGLRPERKIRDRPQWDGKSPGTVAVYGEQGMGDELMFASMLPDLLKTNKVIFDCHPRLKTLFEKSFPEIKCFGTRKEKDIPWAVYEDIDWQIAVGSLGKYFRRSRDKFPGTPYLKADPKPKGSKFRVGISWTGGKKSSRVAIRTVPLMWWESILSNNCEFVSLQYTNSDEEIDMVEKRGFSIVKAPEAKAQDYYETAQLVASCDLVISVCTSVVHLAGALGVPCWVMTPNKPAWRYGISGGMPWYRSVRLYRQPQGDSYTWIPVVKRIGLDLNDLLAERMVKVA